MNARDEDLLRALVDGNIISQAQANLVATDHEATGMNVEDILLARRWVTEELLDVHAPWLKTDHAPTPNASSEPESNSNRSYEENLRRYRQLLAEILGESSE